MKNNKKDSLPIKKSLSFGWEKFKGHTLFFLTVVAVIWLVSFVPSMMHEEISASFPTTALIINIIGFILSLIIGIGLINISIKFSDKKKSVVSDLFSSYDLFFTYLAGAILSTLIIIGGLILLIIPGIIWGIKYQFYGFAIVDKKMGPIEALKESGRITKGKKWELLLFNIVAGLLNFVGFLLFTLGLFITIPVTLIALGYIYRTLSP